MEIQLQTKRLLISPISFSDLDDIHALHSLPETDRYNTLGIPKNLKQTENIVQGWIENNHKEQNSNFTLKIESNTNKDFIGLIALNLGKPKFKIAEVWYKLHPDFWNNGYATEALHKVLEFGFRELGLHRIEAGCAVDNIGSIKVLEKVGMIKEGSKRKVLPLKEGWSDNFEYAILSTEFK